MITTTTVTWAFEIWIKVNDQESLWSDCSWIFLQSNFISFPIPVHFISPPRNICIKSKRNNFFPPEKVRMDTQHFCSRGAKSLLCVESAKINCSIGRSTLMELPKQFWSNKGTRAVTCWLHKLYRGPNTWSEYWEMKCSLSGAQQKLEVLLRRL